MPVAMRWQRSLQHESVTVTDILRFCWFVRFLAEHRVGCAKAAKCLKRHEAVEKLGQLKASFGAKVVKNKGKKPGLKVAKIEVGKALHAAGIKKGDIILGVNGIKVTKVSQFTALQKTLKVRGMRERRR